MGNLTPPLRFSYHSPTIVRSMYPNIAGARFITEQGFRKFVSIGVGFPGTSERFAAKDSKLTLTHFPLDVSAAVEMSPDSAHQSRCVDQVTRIIDHVLRQGDGSKIYLYDDDGYSAVGIVCAVLRRIEGWDTFSALDECFRFSPNNRWHPDMAQLVESFSISRWI